MRYEHWLSCNYNQVKSNPKSFSSGLAELLGVSFTSVNRWENGKYEPTRLVKEKIRLICEQNNIQMEVVKQWQTKDK